MEPIDAASGDTPAEGDKKSKVRDETRFTAGNWISLVALFLSLTTFGWQIVDALRGSQVEIMPLEGRAIEFRCSSGSAQKCWDSDVASLSLIAPAFFSNAGANKYNGVIDTVQIELSSSVLTSNLQANSVWLQAQLSSGSRSRPFAPIVVAGTSSAGSELRFIPFGTKERISWARFTEQIVSGSIQEIRIKMSAHLALKKVWISAACTAKFSDRYRQILERRRTERKAKYLTISCGPSS